MKQIDKKYICYYCLGCNAEEQENFTPRQRCKGFVPGIKDWQTKWREELKKNGNKQ
jgi:hypothetical protein|nr:MAG TPA: hypothetical protein [Caudoviricetes sp.]